MIKISPIKKQRQGFEAQPEMVGKYINEYLYSDVNPVGRIVGIKSKTILYVQPVVATRNKTEMEMIPGGFSYHCTNNRAQEWEYEEQGDIIEVKMTTGRYDWKRIVDAPRKFYDYNF